MHCLRNGKDSTDAAAITQQHLKLQGHSIWAGPGRDDLSLVAVQGLLMTAFLKWWGMSETALGLYRAAGALAGSSATVCFAPLHTKFGARAVHAGQTLLSLQSAVPCADISLAAALPQSA